MKDDSTHSNSALWSARQTPGGMGLNIDIFGLQVCLVAFPYHVLRPQIYNRLARSYIAGTNSYSNGIVPMLRAMLPPVVSIKEVTRPGAFAIHEPWYADIEELRARELCYVRFGFSIFV